MADYPKRDLSWALGLLTVLALGIHTATVSPEGGSGSRDSAPSKNSGSPANTPRSESSVVLEGPWTATRAFFNDASAVEQITPDKLLPLISAKGLGTDSKAWSDTLGLGSAGEFRKWAVVATVADPAHSRFQLFFDQQIASIKLAATNQGWEFAAQWLPWRDGPETKSGIEEKLKERQVERDQEALPGILIFRHWPAAPKDFTTDVLFVLVVGEMPTKGIDGNAFYAAMNLATVLSSPENEIGLLAPTFSGSFESLTRLVTKWPGRPHMLHKHVYGGSISSADYARKFSNATHLEFSSGIASSENYQDVFKNLLSEYHIDKAAYWVEDESGFGASFQDTLYETEDEKHRKKHNEEEVPTYTFPREISHLRNAYQEATQSIRSSVRNVVPRLDLSLKDPSHGEDSIPVFSETHTPVAQSAAISTVTEEFRREGIQIVFIGASNTLDSLLLARFVHNESPNTKVVIGDADLLFIPAASEDALAGTLFLSTYPMFILGNEWLTLDHAGNSGAKESHLIFPGAGQQGIFNVTQLLLADLRANFKSECSGDALQGYRQLFAGGPGNETEHPGLWLLELTHYGFLPVDWFPLKPNSENWFAADSAPARPDECLGSTHSQPPSTRNAGAPPLEERFPLDPPSHGWKIAAIGMTIAMFVSSYLLFIWRKSFPVDKRFPAMLGACLSATSAQLILILPAWRVLLGVDHPPDPPGWVDRAILVLAIGAPITLLLMLSIVYFQSKHEEGDRAYIWKVYAGVILAVFGLISAQWVISAGFLGAADPRVLLFRLRALELFSEGSPALPLFLFSVILSGGFLLHLWRYSLRPESTLQLLEIEKIKAINYSIHAPFDIEAKTLGKRWAVCAILVALAMCNLWDGLRAFEAGYYNWAIYTAVVVILLSITLGSWDLIATWLKLRALLDLLGSESSQRRDAFEHATQHWPRQRVIAPWRSVPEVPHTVSSADENSVSLALSCCRYIVYAARQTQLIAWTVGLALLSLIVTLATYSPQAPQHVGRFLAVLFIVVGAIMIWVFSSMEKNWLLSRIEGTEPSQLNFEFWIHTVAVGALPLVGILIHLFPSIGSFVSSWVAPSLEALR
jgi:hypothetical protein